MDEIKLCYISDIDNEETEVEMKIGHIYRVACIDTGYTGDIICEFTSKLKDMVLEEGKEKDIDELIFENGVTIYQPQYHYRAIHISLEQV